MSDTGDGAQPTSNKRLQREPDFTGDTITTFRGVALRHGLPGAILGILCLLFPPMRELLALSLAPVVAAPTTYLVGGIIILAALSLYAIVIDRGWRPMQLGWVLYLGAVSAWEEWVFRLAVPYWLEQEGVPLTTARIGVNIAFGVMHYFTLRWKWQWCLLAAVGGMALSRQMDHHFDLLLLIAIHWIATFLNTPRAPGENPKG